MKILRFLAIVVVLALSASVYAEGIKLFSPLSKSSVKPLAVSLTVPFKVDAQALKQARQSKELLITDVYLQQSISTGMKVDLELTEFSVVGPNTRVVIEKNGIEVEGAMPTVKTYRGKVVGDPNTLVVLALTEDKVSGMIRFNGREQFTIGHDKTPGVAYVTAVSALAGAVQTGECGMDNEKSFDVFNTIEKYAKVKTSDKLPSQKPQVATKSATIAFDADKQCYDDFGTEQALTDYLVARLAVISSVYESELDVALQLGRFKIYTTTDPYTGSSLQPLLQSFTNYWAANNGSVDRTIAHLISRKLGGGGASGLAWLGVLCSKSNGYGVTNISGSSGFPSIDEAVLAHEIGHNFGSAHTHNCAAYPPDGIDHCVAAEGGCSWTPVQIMGSIMSYCNNKDFTFDTPNDHRVIETIKANIDAAVCLGSVAAIQTLSDTVTFTGKTAIHNKKDSVFNGLIRSIGTVPLVVSNIVIDPGSDTEFVLKAPKTFPITVQPNNSQSVTVTFQPKYGAERAGQMLIYHNGAGSPTAVEILATGAAPEVQELFSGIEYGQIVYKKPLDSQFVYLKNIGDAPLTIYRKYIDGTNAADWVIMTDTSKETVGIGKSTFVKIRFKPQGLGPSSAFFNVDHDAATMQMFVSLDADVTAFDTAQISVGSDLKAAGITMNISPNPSNGKVVVTMTMPDALIGKPATFTIVDMLGKHITTMFEGTLTNATSEFVWSPERSLADGVYTLIATINGKNYTKQIVRMK
jgi:hypothetical protein